MWPRFVVRLIIIVAILILDLKLDFGVIRRGSYMFIIYNVKERYKRVLAQLIAIRYNTQRSFY